MKDLLKHLLVLCVATLSLAAADGNKPNIIVIVADDYGYGDVGFHGSDILTPNLDKLAAEGVALEQFYVAPMCSPTRAGFMTGRYPLRFGLMRSVIPPHRDFGLDPSEDTLPEMLERSGYAHRACIGKWHLGHARSEWRPNQQGFTHFVGCLNGAIDYFSLERDGELDWHKNGEPYRAEGYATDIIGDESVAFIESVPTEDPYFLYVPFNAPHSPFQAKKEDLKKYPNREGDFRTYAAMVDCMDQNIGRILEAVEERGDAENTFILFFSDNGGVKKAASNGPLRGYKLTSYQGGIRVAAAVKWPAGNIQGGGVVNERVGYIDVMPTLKAIVGDETPAKRPFDGLNVLESIRGNESLADRPWFTYFDQSGARVQRLAVNRDKVKMVASWSADDAKGDPVRKIEVFAIDKDPEEKRDISASHPELTQELVREMEAFLKLRSKTQVSRYLDGKKGFKSPKDWALESEG